MFPSDLRQCQAPTYSPSNTMGSLQENQADFTLGGWICSQERPNTHKNTQMTPLPFQRRKSPGSKTPNTNSELVMHGMHCQLLKQTESQELAQPVAKKQQHLEGARAVGQACLPSHCTDLCPKRHLFEASNPKCNRATWRRG